MYAVSADGGKQAPDSAVPHLPQAPEFPSLNDEESAMLVVLGVGMHGADEMQALLDDVQVQFAVVRFELGSGSFRRQKVVFVHFNGEDCPAVKRGRLNCCTAEAQRILRGNCQEGFHASVEIMRKELACAEHLLEKVTPFFVKDDLGDVSFRWKNERQEVVLPNGRHGRRHSAPAGLGQETADRLRRLPGHESTAEFTSGRDALRAVAEPLGPWNWVLVGPDPVQLPLVAGGAGSIEELQKYLAAHDDGVFFGLLRLGFGAGRLRRTKYIFVHVYGARVPAVRRGQLALHRVVMEKAVATFACCAVHFVDSVAEDLSLQMMIERVRRCGSVDDDVLGNDEAGLKRLSSDSFREALSEERQIADQRVPTPIVTTGVALAKGSALTVEEAVALIHDPDGPLDWVLFGPSQSLLRNSSQTPRHVGLATPVGGYVAAQSRARVTQQGLNLPSLLSSSADRNPEVSALKTPSCHGSPPPNGESQGVRSSPFFL